MQTSLVLHLEFLIFFFLFKSPQLCLFYGTHLCNAGTLLFCNHPPCGPIIKTPCPAPCQEGNWGGSSKDRSRAVSGAVGGGNDCLKVTRKAAPSLALISGEHGASRPKTFEPLLRESCLNSWWLLSVHGWLLGILGVCSRMHLELESPASDKRKLYRSKIILCFVVVQRLFLLSLKYAKSNIIKPTRICKLITKGFLLVFGTAQGGEQKLLDWKRIPQENEVASKTQTTVCLWFSPWTTKVWKNVKHGKCSAGIIHGAELDGSGEHTKKRKRIYKVL